MACKCSKLAKEGGNAGFAMHFYGMCYGRTQSEIEEAGSKKHIENKCVGDQTYTICEKSKHDHCTGKEGAGAIYTFISKPPEESKYTKDIVSSINPNPYFN